jgi:hypothetical protein
MFEENKQFKETKFSFLAHLKLTVLVKTVTNGLTAKYQFKPAKYFVNFNRISHRETKKN